jgi:hypothetical protein
MPELLEQIDENTRLTSDYDFHSYSLADILSDFTGVQTINIASGYHNISTGDDDISTGVNRIVEAFPYWNKDYEAKRERAIGAWLTAKGYVFEFVSLRGYSQGEWADILVYTTLDNSEYLYGEIDTLNSWFRGDIYNIAKEQRKIYRADDGDTLEVWETVDSVGGFIGVSVEDMIVIGREL